MSDNNNDESEVGRTVPAQAGPRRRKSGRKSQAHAPVPVAPVVPEAPIVASVLLRQQNLGVLTGRWIEVWQLAWHKGGIVVRTIGKGNQVIS